MDTTKNEILEAISPSDYYNEHYPEWTGNEGDFVLCPTHDDSTPSLSINPASGAFYCHACGWKGSSIVGHYTDIVCNGSYARAVARLYARYVRPTIPVSEIRNYIRELKRRPKLKQKILNVRGWTEATIKKLKLGWCPDKKRVVIPIFNLAGLCIDIKFHDTLKLAPKKNNRRIPVLGLSKGRGGRTGDWFPLSPKINPFSSSSRSIWLLEGEPDTLLGLQDGLNAITLTGGVGAWERIPNKQLACLSGSDVILCFDRDKAGKGGSRALVERLAGVDIRSCRVVELPEGGDLTEFFMRYNGSADQLKQIAISTPYSISPKNRTTEQIPLADTSKADLVGKSILTDVLVNGKSSSPVTVPRRIMLSCASGDKCHLCPCHTDAQVEHNVLKDDPDILEWVFARDYRMQLRKELSLPNKCPISYEVIEFQNLEPVTVIPALGMKESKNTFVSRRAYFLGHGLESNQHYNVTATPVVHPKSKESVLLIEKAKGTYDSIHNFKLTDTQLKELKEVFCDSPKKTIKDICKMLSRNHTRIYGRWDLHAAIDLVYHSPMQFSFANTELPKGCMELILIGDTRCGKGQVCEGMAKFYDLGVVVSGENASFMGLVGGAKPSDRGFELSWGRIPTNHGRLVIIDEFSGFKDMGKLSRIRSEGVAELDKGGIHSSTMANTRLIWIANPKSGRDLSSFSTGVSALQDLVGANEDIARFDLAVAVAKGEIDVATINQQPGSDIQSKYSRRLLQLVALWVWSRGGEHILFDRDTTEYILAESQKLSGRYSSTIPLIQGENIRFKLAKIAAAVAGRCFSTDDGIFLRVRKDHARTATDLLRYFYDKSCMGYRAFSDTERGTGTISEEDMKRLQEFFLKRSPHMRQVMIDGLLETNKFGIREIQDWCGVDANIAKKYGGLFVQTHAVKQITGGMYVKKAQFIKFLRGMDE